MLYGYYISTMNFSSTKISRAKISARVGQHFFYSKIDLFVRIVYGYQPVAVFDFDQEIF